MGMILLLCFFLFLSMRKAGGCLKSLRNGKRQSSGKEKEGQKAGGEKKHREPMTGLAREAFSELTRQVTGLVEKDFPGAGWIWEEPDAMQQILLGGEVHILLNRAGGYRRAEVIYRNLDVAALDFRMEKAGPAPLEPDPEEPVEDNYCCPSN